MTTRTCRLTTATVAALGGDLYRVMSGAGFIMGPSNEGTQIFAIPVRVPVKGTVTLTAELDGSVTFTQTIEDR